jgi:5-methylcytosine-specific restriction protein A
MLKPCTVPRCPELVENGRCKRHRRPKAKRRFDYKRDQATRGTAAQRGYDRRWRKLRDDYASTHPYCESPEHQGKYVPMKVVDHCVPIRQGGPRLSRQNLQSLCGKCHAKKTGKERAHGTAKGIRGQPNVSGGHVDRNCVSRLPSRPGSSGF